MTSAERSRRWDAAHPYLKRGAKYIKWHKKFVNQWRKDNPDKIKLYTKTHQSKKYRLMEIIKNKPCADCQGWYEPCQMDFDHKPGYKKVRNVSQLIRHSIRNLFNEIKKCDLVCANCHRLRTQKRNQRDGIEWGRYA